MRTIKCKSGVKGWQDHLQNGYDSPEEFKGYCDNYNLHTRLGFDTPEEAWEANPVVESSVNPSDFRVVPNSFDLNPVKYHGASPVAWLDKKVLTVSKNIY